MSGDGGTWYPGGQEPAASQPPPPGPAQLYTGGVVLTPLPETAGWVAGPSPRRRRTGLSIGVVIGAVALVGAGVAGWVLVGSKLMPARSPEAAVQRLVDGLTQKDGLALLGALSPADLAPVRETLELAGGDVAAAPDDATAAAWTEALDTVTLVIEDLRLETTLLDDGLARVAVVGGTLRLDGDPDRLSHAAATAVEGVTGELPPADVDSLRSEVRGAFYDLFPVELDLATAWEFEGEEPFLVAVHEGRGWYVSPLMTLGEYMAVGSGIARGEMPEGDPAAAADPETAAGAAVDALVGLALGDARALADVLPVAERRWVNVYLQPLMEQSWPAELEGMRVDVVASDFAMLESDDDVAAIGASNLVLEVEVDGQMATLAWDGDCIVVSGPDRVEAQTSCMSDIPLYAELGLDPGFFVAVLNEGGQWHASLLAAMTRQMAILSDAFGQLAADGRLLDEQWWEDQVAAVAQVQQESLGSAPATGEPWYYGDDPYLDEMWDACEAGDQLACDDLYHASVAGSDYEWYGGTCGLLGDPALAGTCFEQATGKG